MRLSIGMIVLATSALSAQDVDTQLDATLRRAGFTGTAGASIERRLGRPIDSKLANLGRLLFFDKIGSLHSDNACAGCHSPTAGFGDTQSIAIGIQNNNLVYRFSKTYHILLFRVMLVPWREHPHVRRSFSPPMRRVVSINFANPRPPLFAMSNERRSVAL